MRRTLFWLSDRQWARIESHWPTDLHGVARVDDLGVINGIVQRLDPGADIAQTIIGAINAIRRDRRLHQM